jgi:hypothetical protein
MRSVSHPSERAPGPSDVQERAIADEVNRLVHPPEACPGCLAEAGQSWPEGATSRFCPQCVSRARRVYQCQRWNADPTHQSAAGQASFTAFSARWRAEQGLAPLTVEAARRYVVPEQIRGPVGALLPERFQQLIYRAWCAGLLLGVEAWLSDDPPPEPGGLWAQTRSSSVAPRA